MTLLYIALSIFPIVEVVHWWAFTAKISGVVILGNLIGIALYEIAERKRNRAAKMISQ